MKQTSVVVFETFCVNQRFNQKMYPNITYFTCIVNLSLQDSAKRYMAQLLFLWMSIFSVHCPFTVQ